MHNKTNTPTEIFLTQGYNMENESQIARLECNRTRQTLGCHIYCKGNMIHKDQTAAIVMNKVYLSRQEAHMPYHGILKA